MDKEEQLRLQGRICEYLGIELNHSWTLDSWSGVGLIINKLMEKDIAFTLKNRAGKYRFALSYNNHLIHNLEEEAHDAVINTMKDLIEMEKKK